MDKTAPFLHAQKVLEYLESEGMITAKAELYADGSGRLVIRHGDQLPLAVQTRIKVRLEQLLHSSRWEHGDDGTVSLSSCAGWHP